jgi:hypothetical protein
VLASKRKWLPDALPKPKKSAPQGLLSEIASIPNVAALFAAIPLSGAPPEGRTRDQYVAEIDAWEAAVRRELPKLLDKVAGDAWASVGLRARNNTDTYLNRPEFDVHIEGLLDALDKRDELIDLLDKLPDRPRR